MNTRKPLPAIIVTLVAASAFGLLVSLVLCLTMPDEWEYRGAAEGVRKLCFIGVIAGGAVRAMNEYKAKKQSETASPAPGAKAKAK